MRNLNLNLVPFVEYCQHFIFGASIYINHSSLVILGCFEVVNVWCTVMQQPTMVGNRSAPKLSFSQPTTVVKPVSQLGFENIFWGAHQFRVNPWPNTLLSVNQPLSVNFSSRIFALKVQVEPLFSPCPNMLFPQSTNHCCSQASQSAFVSGFSFVKYRSDSCFPLVTKWLFFFQPFSCSWTQAWQLSTTFFDVVKAESKNVPFLLLFSVSALFHIYLPIFPEGPFPPLKCVCHFICLICLMF